MLRNFKKFSKKIKMCLTDDMQIVKVTFDKLKMSTLSYDIRLYHTIFCIKKDHL